MDEVYFSVIRGNVFTEPMCGNGDCLQIIGGRGKTLLHKCVFDLRGVPLKEQNEALTFINGAQADVVGCLFIGCKQAIRVGDGNFPQNDRDMGLVNLHNCVFLDCGKHTPEAQDGVVVRMSNCWVHNLGISTFEDYVSGAHCTNRALIDISDCIFTWTHRLSCRNAMTDVMSQVRRKRSAYGRLHCLLHPWKVIKPGTMRATECGREGILVTDNVHVSSLLKPFDPSEQCAVYKIIQQIDRAFSDGWKRYTKNEKSLADFFFDEILRNT